MQMLGEDGGRRDMEARLGPEACDAIDEFLRLALDHEREAAPSLAAFLAGLEGAEFQVKRDMEAAGQSVRVMTVHAAKGLEDKIVFLPDTCSAPSAQHDPKLFALPGDSGPIIAWSPRKDLDPPQIEAARAKARESAQDEYRRLLYVALTRAEERLYIAGFHGMRAPPPGCWSEMIQTALAAELDEVPAFWNSEEMILRRMTSSTAHTAGPHGHSTDERSPSAVSDGVGYREPSAVPDWLLRRSPSETVSAPPLRPSSALAAADASAENLRLPAERAALQRGRLIHILLQHLPAVSSEHRRPAALAFLAARAGDLDAVAQNALVDQALTVITSPAHAALFAPGSRSEVAVAGRFTHVSGKTIAVTGQIDRLAEAEDEILVADYKTGLPCTAAETPKAYLAQMALYRAVLAPLWPGKRLRMLIVWTAGPSAVTLEEAQLDAALLGVLGK
jgi:ATP-dependent helicase/nuclease subunit A